MTPNPSTLRQRLRRGKMEPPEGRPNRIRADELRKALNAAGMSYRGLASAAGCTPAMIGHLLAGRYRASVSLSRRIRAALGLPDPVKSPLVIDGTPADLWGYFQHVYKPACLADRKPVYVEQFASAISCLYYVLGRDPLLTESITEEEIETMKRIMLDEEYFALTATKYGYLLRSVLRHARGEQEFPTRSGRWQRDHGEYAPVDAEGTLYWFYRHRVEPRLLVASKEYRVLYEGTIRSFCRYCKNGAIGLNDLSDDLLIEFAQGQLSDGLAIDTVRTKLAVIRRLWIIAAKRKLLANVPDNIRLPSVRRQPRAWSMDEMGRLLRACLETPGSFRRSKIPAGLFWHALVLLTYDTGLRLRSVLAIRRADLNRQTGWLTVPSEFMKNRKEQSFLLHADTLKAIEAIWEPARDKVFPWPNDRSHFSRSFRKIVVRAGLKFSPKDGMHRIRRTSCTHLAALVGIAEASRHLGHSDVSVTLRYIDDRFMPIIKAGEILPRPVMPPISADKGGAA